MPCSARCRSGVNGDLANCAIPDVRAATEPTLNEAPDLHEMHVEPE
ncbi:hypothetical protein [Amycolatopsis pigmentata]|uniref:Uncharacterized protein n=1 Tax=Amycolatopsis pigmentata TaxID=450801 RepID=A0ABW5FL56_9PSEU